MSQQTTDFAAIKASLLDAAANGSINALAGGARLTYPRSVRDSLAAARHLGSITFEEVEAADLHGEGVNKLPRHLWPAGDVTCLLIDGDLVTVAWLHGKGPRVAELRVLELGKRTGEWFMLPTFIVGGGRPPRSTVRLGFAPVMELQPLLNSVACAMDALVLLLSRPAADAA